MEQGYRPRFGSLTCPHEGFRLLLAGGPRFFELADGQQKNAARHQRERIHVFGAASNAGDPSERIAPTQRGQLVISVNPAGFRISSFTERQNEIDS